MKKVLVTLAIVLFAATSANAMPFVLNPDGVLGTAYGPTGVFNQLGVYFQTTSNEVGGAFSDVGNVAVTSLIPSVNNAGLDQQWQFTGLWKDLVGTQSGGSFLYTAGTLDLYVSSTKNYNFGSSIGAEDDVNFDTGVKVASLSLVEGYGFLLPVPTPKQYIGTVDLTWEFTYLNSDFWLDQYGNEIDLSKLSAGEKLFAFADANTDLVELYPQLDGSLIVKSDHNGSVGIGVVPEPTSMVLFGTGLFGLAGAGLRKKILG